MRTPLLALLLVPAAALAGDLGRVPVDWTRLETPLAEEQIEGLRELGLRLEPDGRALDPELNVLDEEGLLEALRLLDAGGRRERLERLRVLLATQPQDEHLSGEALERARQLAVGVLPLPLHHPATAGELRRLVDLDLSGAAASFDGGAGKGAVAVAAPGSAPAARPRLPCLTLDEQRASESLRAAAVAELSKLGRGRLILSRLDGKDGTPDLPPILVEPLGTPARYDANRRALVLDRDLVMTELMQDVLPVDRAARRRELDRPDGLASALAADPGAARRVLERQDVIVAHELTHAWQDRRDRLFRQMMKGVVPTALVLEYEEEAFVEKNLYIHEKVKRTPGTYVDSQEFDDYLKMTERYDLWKADLLAMYRAAEPSSAALGEIRAIQTQRIADARQAPVQTTAEQLAKAARLRRLARGSLDLQRVEAAHRDRIAALRAHELAAGEKEFDLVMARHNLQLALDTENEIRRAVKLDQARRLAEASGDQALLREIESYIGRKR